MPNQNGTERTRPKFGKMPAAGLCRIGLTFQRLLFNGILNSGPERILEQSATNRCSGLCGNHLAIAVPFRRSPGSCMRSANLLHRAL